MTQIRRIAKLVTGVTAFLLYVWYAAVRYTPHVKRRKARRRPPRRSARDRA